MPETLTHIQEYFVELYEIFRQTSKVRNPSDAKFSKWLNIKPASLNNYINGYRRPDLVSTIQMAQALGRHGIKDYMNIFDVVGYPRVWVAPNSEIEYLIEFWKDLPADLKAEINQAINKILKNKDAANDENKVPDDQ